MDEEVLRAVKADKKLRYLNDVYPKDEAGPKSMTDIADLMLPHLGANTHEANYVAAQRAAQELIDLDEKGDMSCIVNRDIPEGLERAYCELAYNLASLVRQLSGTQTPIKILETSFYGALAPFGKWLTVSVLSGIWHDFDRYNDYKAAMKYVKEMGHRTDQPRSQRREGIRQCGNPRPDGRSAEQGAEGLQRTRHRHRGRADGIAHR